MNDEIGKSVMKIRREKKIKKIALLVIMILLLLLLIIFLVIGLIYNKGNFTVSLDKNLYYKKNLIIYDNTDYKVYRSDLYAKVPDTFDNISYKWLPENINDSNGGSHNGDNYLAYTFFIENVGEDVSDYWYEVFINDVIKNVDRAVRVRIYKNGQAVTYAKLSETGELEKDTVVEDVEIENMGDSNAMISYDIASASILNEDNYTIANDITSDYVEDKLSHDYPFHININLSRKYALKKGGKSSFRVSVWWPLDSGNDNLDSEWGNKAYEYKNNNEGSSIKVSINLKAEQLDTDDDISDVNYNLGDVVLYDPVNNRKCTALSSSCFKTTIIDVNNKIGDDNVTLLMDVLDDDYISSNNNYTTIYSNRTSTWTTENRALNISDMLNVISTDIKDSTLVSKNISPTVIGNLSYNDRMRSELERRDDISGNYLFNREKFKYLATTSCYWVKNNYDENSYFSVVNDGENVNIKEDSSIKNCKVIPVIIAKKTSLK